MSFLPALVLGILIGWLVEWVIDWVYWRKKYDRLLLEKQALEIKAQEAATAASEPLPARAAAPADVVPTINLRDDLKIIRGIGPEIERRLNQAGIMTFAELGALSSEDLETILGPMITRLSNEDSLLDQARELAVKK